MVPILQMRRQKHGEVIKNLATQLVNDWAGLESKQVGCRFCDFPALPCCRIRPRVEAARHASGLQQGMWGRRWRERISFWLYLKVEPTGFVVRSDAGAESRWFGCFHFSLIHWTDRVAFNWSGENGGRERAGVWDTLIGIPVRHLSCRRWA